MFGFECGAGQIWTEISWGTNTNTAGRRQQRDENKTLDEDQSIIRQHRSLMHIDGAAF